MNILKSSRWYSLYIYFFYCCASLCIVSIVFCWLALTGVCKYFNMAQTWAWAKSSLIHQFSTLLFAGVRFYLHNGYHLTSSISWQWVPLPEYPVGHGPHTKPSGVSWQRTPGKHGLFLHVILTGWHPLRVPSPVRRSGHAPHRYPPSMSTQRTPCNTKVYL